jgi:hypothetical protein
MRSQVQGSTFRVKDKEGIKAYSFDISSLDLTHTVKTAMASIMAKR